MDAKLGETTEAVKGLPVITSNQDANCVDVSIGLRRCKVSDCACDLASAPKTHQRFRLCNTHIKAPVILVDRVASRFCQQCSRFHPLKEFNGTNRTCRIMLTKNRARQRGASSCISTYGTPQAAMIRKRLPSPKQLPVLLAAMPVWSLDAATTALATPTTTTSTVPGSAGFCAVPAWSPSLPDLPSHAQLPPFASDSCPMAIVAVAAPTADAQPPSTVAAQASAPARGPLRPANCPDAAMKGVQSLSSGANQTTTVITAGTGPAVVATAAVNPFSRYSAPPALCLPNPSSLKGHLLFEQPNGWREHLDQLERQQQRLPLQPQQLPERRYGLSPQPDRGLSLPHALLRSKHSDNLTCRAAALGCTASREEWSGSGRGNRAVDSDIAASLAVDEELGSWGGNNAPDTAAAASIGSGAGGRCSSCGGDDICGKSLSLAGLPTAGLPTTCSRFSFSTISAPSESSRLLRHDLRWGSTLFGRSSRAGLAAVAAAATAARSGTRSVCGGGCSSSGGGDVLHRSGSSGSFKRRRSFASEAVDDGAVSIRHRSMSGGVEPSLDHAMAIAAGALESSSPGTAAEREIEPGWSLRLHQPQAKQPVMVMAVTGQVPSGTLMSSTATGPFATAAAAGWVHGIVRPTTVDSWSPHLVSQSNSPCLGSPLSGGTSSAAVAVCASLAGAAAEQPLPPAPRRPAMDQQPRLTLSDLTMTIGTALRGPSVDALSPAHRPPPLSAGALTQMLDDQASCDVPLTPSGEATTLVFGALALDEKPSCVADTWRVSLDEAVTAPPWSGSPAAPLVNLEAALGHSRTLGSARPLSPGDVCLGSDNLELASLAAEWRCEGGPDAADTELLLLGALEEASVGLSEPLAQQLDPAQVLPSFWALRPPPPSPWLLPPLPEATSPTVQQRPRTEGVHSTQHESLLPVLNSTTAASICCGAASRGGSGAEGNGGRGGGGGGDSHGAGGYLQSSFARASLTTADASPDIASGSAGSLPIFFSAVGSDALVGPVATTLMPPSACPASGASDCGGADQVGINGGGSGASGGGATGSGASCGGWLRCDSPTWLRSAQSEPAWSFHRPHSSPNQQLQKSQHSLHRLGRPQLQHYPLQQRYHASQQPLIQQLVLQQHHHLVDEQRQQQCLVPKHSPLGDQASREGTSNDGVAATADASLGVDGSNRVADAAFARLLRDVGEASAARDAPSGIGSNSNCISSSGISRKKAVGEETEEQLQLLLGDLFGGGPRVHVPVPVPVPLQLAHTAGAEAAATDSSCLPWRQQKQLQHETAYRANMRFGTGKHGERVGAARRSRREPRAPSPFPSPPRPPGDDLCAAGEKSSLPGQHPELLADRLFLDLALKQQQRMWIELLVMQKQQRALLQKQIEQQRALGRLLEAPQLLEVIGGARAVAAAGSDEEQAAVGWVPCEQMTHEQIEGRDGASCGSGSGSDVGNCSGFGNGSGSRDGGCNESSRGCGDGRVDCGEVGGSWSGGGGSGSGSISCEVPAFGRWSMPVLRGSDSGGPQRGGGSL